MLRHPTNEGAGRAKQKLHLEQGWRNPHCQNSQSWVNWQTHERESERLASNGIQTNLPFESRWRATKCVLIVSWGRCEVSGTFLAHVFFPTSLPLNLSQMTSSLENAISIVWFNCGQVSLKSHKDSASRGQLNNTSKLAVLSTLITLNTSLLICAPRNLYDPRQMYLCNCTHHWGCAQKKLQNWLRQCFLNANVFLFACPSCHRSGKHLQYRERP